MGTKTEPGKFDCYKKLEPDEPYFLLRGKDPAAPYLTMMWAASRNGDWTGLLDLVTAMRLNQDVVARVSTDENPKLAEAMHCARTMKEWQLRRKGLTNEGETIMTGNLTVEHGDGSED
jgi:hypothetical protein